MSALFWLVVRWIAAVLIGVAAGSAGAALGYKWVTASVGAVALLIGGTFVGASVLASYVSALSGTRRSDAIGKGLVSDLVGPGLLRATLLGFVGAGATAGSVSGNEFTAVISALTGAIAILLSLGGEPADQRRPK